MARLLKKDWTVASRRIMSKKKDRLNVQRKLAKCASGKMSLCGLTPDYQLLSKIASW